VVNSEELIGTTISDCG